MPLKTIQENRLLKHLRIIGEKAHQQSGEAIKDDVGEIIIARSLEKHVCYNTKILEAGEEQMVKAVKNPL